jgi:hypothetical protein
VYVTFGTEITQLAPIGDVLAALASLDVDAVRPLRPARSTG